MQPTLSGADVGDVADPDTVGVSRPEVAAHQTRGAGAALREPRQRGLRRLWTPRIAVTRISRSMRSWFTRTPQRVLLGAHPQRPVHAAGVGVNPAYLCDQLNPAGAVLDALASASLLV